MTTISLPATAAERRRDDLARFLRSRRARIGPSDVGLPEGQRRRTPGLRREEVAQLAGVGVTWYTWLEQGRSINASVQVLDAIARTLRLDRAEREHLYLLAGLPTVADAGESCLAPEIQDILDALVPLPAVVYNGRYDVLAWNRSYAAIFPNVTGAPPAERNVLWQMFAVPMCCSVLGNRDVELTATVAMFRSAFGRHVGEPSWTSFVDELCAASAEFAAMWARHDVASPGNRVKVFLADVGRQEIRTTSSTFAVSGTPDARLVVYTPVGATDRRRLIELVTREPAMPMCGHHRPDVPLTTPSAPTRR